MKTLLPALSFLTVLVSSGYSQDAGWLNVPPWSAASQIALENSGAGGGAGARDLAGDDSSWGVVLPGVDYVITPGGFKEPPGPGEGAGITVSRFGFEIRGTPGADVTITTSLPDAFVSHATSDSLPITSWVVVFLPDDSCSCLHCCDYWPLTPDTLEISIGISGSTFLYFGAAFSVPLTASPGSYSAGITVSYPGLFGAAWAVGEGGRVSSPASDTTVHRDIEVVPLTDVPDGGILPLEFALHQNYPNPFNPATTISFDLPEAAHVNLSIFNALGQEIAVVVDEMKGPGTTSFIFDAGKLPSGVYTCRIAAGLFTDVKKMLLIR